eukprot:6214221-Pleurochrysis_carterae.AAC.2
MMCSLPFMWSLPRKHAVPLLAPPIRLCFLPSQPVAISPVLVAILELLLPTRLSPQFFRTRQTTYAKISVIAHTFVSTQSRPLAELATGERRSGCSNGGRPEGHVSWTRTPIEWRRRARSRAAPDDRLALLQSTTSPPPRPPLESHTVYSYCLDTVASLAELQTLSRHVCFYRAIVTGVSRMDHSRLVRVYWPVGPSWRRPDAAGRRRGAAAEPAARAPLARA